MRKTIRAKYAMLIIVTAAILLLQESMDRIGWEAARIFDYSAIDSDGIFMTVSVHHAVIAGFSLLVMLLLYKTKRFTFGLKPKIERTAVKYTVAYCIFIFVYYILWYVIIGFLLNGVNGVGYALTGRNVIGTLGFQLLLSGPAEELLFRALPVACLRAVCTEGKKTDALLILFLTSLLFTAAHINWHVAASSQWYSLLYVFFNGIAYGFVYLKTKRIIYPMLMHSISNVISVSGCYLYMMLSSAA